MTPKTNMSIFGILSATKKLTNPLNEIAEYSKLNYERNEELVNAVANIANSVALVAQAVSAMAVGIRAIQEEARRMNLT